MNTIETENKLGIQFCNRQNIAIERGEGCYVWDEEGKKYLDFTSGWGVTCLGHSHPIIAQTLCDQAYKIIQNPNSGFTYSPYRARLMNSLQQVLPAGLNKLFFSNSGAEANDAAIKLARKISGRSKVVSTLGSFHGRTFNTLSVSVGTDNTDRYLPRMAGNQFVAFNDMEAMEQAIDGSTAAVIVEPIQGEGGVRLADMNYLSGIAKLCQGHGALLIVDEIQTGFCRTGRFFALEYERDLIQPDILTMGKGIAGGFPFAAFAVTDSINKRLQLGDHGGTYCGNPLGCAVATSVVDFLVENKVAVQVEEKGKLLLDLLQRLRLKYADTIVACRGRGLLCAMEFGSDKLVQSVTQACLESGLLVTPTRNNILRLIPSLLVTEAEIEITIGILDKVLRRYS